MHKGKICHSNLCGDAAMSQWTLKTFQLSEGGRYIHDQLTVELLSF